MTLDLSTLKPNTICISRDGREWEYIGRASNKGAKSPHILCSEHGDVEVFRGNGVSSRNGPTCDIISIKPEERVLERWVNIYANGTAEHSLSKEEADRRANPRRIACKHIKITYFEGEGL